MAQNGFTDDFSDGNFTVDPTWTEETSRFIINGTNQLQLDDPAGATAEAHLVTASTVINNGSWEFSVNLNFAPSGSNFSRVYLVSNSSDLQGSLQGYFVQIGGQSGSSDEVSLYKQDGIVESKIIDGVDGTVATNPNVKIKVTKDNNINNLKSYLQ